MTDFSQIREKKRNHIRLIFTDPLLIRRFGVRDIDGCCCDSSWKCGDHGALAQEAISKSAHSHPG